MNQLAGGHAGGQLGRRQSKMMAENQNSALPAVARLAKHFALAAKLAARGSRDSHIVCKSAQAHEVAGSRGLAGRVRYQAAAQGATFDWRLPSAGLARAIGQSGGSGGAENLSDCHKERWKGA